MKKQLLTIFLFLLSSCTSTEEKTTLGKDFLKDDNGNLYTKERLTAENTFLDDWPEEDNSDIVYSDTYGRRSEPCMVKTMSRENETTLPINFTIGCACYNDYSRFKSRNENPFVYCQICIDEKEDNKYRYKTTKAAVLPKLNEGYTYFGLKVNGQNYLVFNIYTIISIDFSSLYNAVNGKSGFITFGYLAPTEKEENDKTLESLCIDNQIIHSRARSYQFSFKENGKQVVLERIKQPSTY